MRTKNGFTILEMLVVTLIIGLLAGLLAVAGRAALRYFGGVSEKNSLDQIAGALEIYKNDFGEYPPDGTDVDAIKKHLLKRWPQLLGKKINNIVMVDYLVDNVVPNGANAYRSLGFWLAADFNLENLENPPAEVISLLGNLKPLYELKKDFKDISEIGKQKRGINYNIALGCPSLPNGYPIAYFVAQPRRNVAGWPLYSDVLSRDKGDYALRTGSDPTAPYGTIKSLTVGSVSNLGVAAPYAKSSSSGSDGLGRYEWYGKGYQLITVGEDGSFGGILPSGDIQNLGMPRIPSEKLGVTKEDDDNITNFTGGTTLDSEYPQ